MSSKVQEPVYRFDTLKWVVVALVAICVIFGYQYFTDKIADIYRWLGLFVGVVVSLAIIAFTKKGAAVWGLLREA